jgi:hypothetical protein
LTGRIVGKNNSLDNSKLKIILWTISPSLSLSLLGHRPKFYANTDDDASESAASFASAESEEESNHHLLTVPSGDVAFLKEKPVRLARELL